MYSSSEPLKNEFSYDVIFVWSFSVSIFRSPNIISFLLSLGRRLFIRGCMLLFFKLSSLVASGYTNPGANNDWTHRKMIYKSSFLCITSSWLTPSGLLCFLLFVKSIKLCLWPISSPPYLFPHLITYTIHFFLMRAFCSLSIWAVDQECFLHLSLHIASPNILI